MPHADEIERAIEVFVRGFCVGKSVTHPYDCLRVGDLWLLRDAPRKNPRNYRKEEWIAYSTPPRQVDAAARRETRGRFFVGVMRGMNAPEDDLRAEYKALGYRLLATEPLFVHRLQRIPRLSSPVSVVRVTTAKMAAQFGAATRTRPIALKDLAAGAAFRQYVAIEQGQLIGWVRSVDAVDSTWCSHMYVRPEHRRRGVGSALLLKMLRDDRQRGARQSVLLSSHSGALLYPRVGYEQLGTLLIFAPRRTK